ncbi:uncharacterized protein [Montipora capricornis]|uniref:uncharacterized protein n=1 Tax=Montipora capricornis TaxID=246305 RepID=UPI0035F1E59A
MKKALAALIRAVQQSAYSRIITQLQTNRMTNLPPLVGQLGLYIDVQKLLRCRGRLKNAPLQDNTKYLILIPKDTYLAELIIRATHLMVMHAGVRETLTQLRQTYWILKGRQLVKRILHQCVTRKKAEGRPFRSVNFPLLPQPRVTGSQPFQVTGVDYAGPLYVRNNKTETSKCYVCLFTCAAIRTVHLELLQDNTVNAFLKAFTRFISRRGVPECIISDNTQTFQASSEVLQPLKTQILKEAGFQKFLANHCIQWQFITERAPWWGGFYERMFGLVKKRLKKTIGRASLNAVELATMLTEIEANFEPPCPESTEEDPEYLPNDLTPTEFTKKFRYHQRLMQMSWRQWRNEYLTSLREHHWTRRASYNQKIKVGDVVLIHDDTSRNQWRLGSIIKVHRAKDDLIRAVSLRVSNGRELSRPIEKLYPLEIHSDEKEELTKQTSHNKEHDICLDKQTRPKRAAAQVAAQKIKKLSH